MTRFLHFILLSLALLFAGCSAGDEGPFLGEETLPVELTEERTIDFAPDLSLPNVGLTQTPQVESFSVEPANLPVGGGEILISWSSRFSTTCSIFIDGFEVKVDEEGSLEVDVTSSTDLSITCYDDLGWESGEVSFDVTVETTPVDFLGSDSAAVALASPDVKTLATKVASGAPVQFEVTIESNSLFSARATSEGMATDVSVWLVQDVNGDGQLQQDEVIDYNLSRPEVDAGDQLDAGTYWVIVCPDAETAGFLLTLKTKPA